MHNFRDVIAIYWPYLTIVVGPGYSRTRWALSMQTIILDQKTLFNWSGGRDWLVSTLLRPKVKKHRSNDKQPWTQTHKMRKCPWVYFKERHLRFNMTTNSSSRGISSLWKIGLTWRKIDSSDLVTSRTSRDISLGMCCKSNLPQMNPLSVFIYRRINIEDARLLKPSYIQSYNMPSVQLSVSKGPKVCRRFYLIFMRP